MTAKEDRTQPNRPVRALWFSLLAVGVGVVAGFGAVVFRGLIGLFHNVMFLGKWSFTYDANAYTPTSPWGLFVILVPVLGAAGVAYLVKTFAPEAKGHGVPEVMDAIYYNRGRIRPVVAVVKSLASALSIGSGGSVGREGPIIQIGSSFGSSVGQWLRVPIWQRIALIAGGAGAGIAATFNTPVGGILFALELMMHEVSVRTLVPVALATAAGTYIGRLAFGPHPSFVIPDLESPYFHITAPLVLFSYVGLGVLTGAVSALFIKSIYAAEDFFERRVKGGYFGQHLLGMFAVGLMLYGLKLAFGHYYVEGVGYSTVQETLAGVQMPLYLLAILFGMKLLATSATLGSGASGGVFSPALFLGATLGTAYGMVLSQIFPQLHISPPAFAVAGMAGVVGGSTGAALAAIVMIFEMTLDYNVIVPMTITVAVSYGIRKVLAHESIYTMKLARRGHHVPEALRTSPHFVRRAHKLMLSEFGHVSALTPLGEFGATVRQQPPAFIYLVENEDRVVGFVRCGDVLNALKDDAGKIKLGDLADHSFITVSRQATLLEVLGQMRASGASIALVTDGTGQVEIGRIDGLITRERVSDVTGESLELFLD
jgi:chloride channel protein, CIC family